MADDASRLIPLAEVARPHGVRGELRLKIYNRDSDLLLDLDKVVLEPVRGERTVVRVREARRANDAMLVWLEGCDSRDRADELRGAKLLASRDVFPPLDADEFYVCDVIGAKAVGPEGEVGVVESLLSYPTCDALVIRRGKGDTIELPLVDGVVDEVDIKAAVVRLASSNPLAATDEEEAAAKAAKAARPRRERKKRNKPPAGEPAGSGSASGDSGQPSGESGQADDDESGPASGQ